MSKRAIATLIKGYPQNYESWDVNLIVVRNKSIHKNLTDDCDLIIFHEGNLLEEHKKFIVQRSHIKYPIKFIEVTDFHPSEIDRLRLTPLVDDVCTFTTGYSSMCKFWTNGFIKYLDDYDYVIRLDDDCIALNDIEVVFKELENHYIVYPKLSGEVFRKGLKDFTERFFTKIHPIENYEEIDKIKVPYTNFTGFNLNKIREDKVITNFMDIITKGEYIYKYTWQDTQLWGLLIQYYLKEMDYKELNTVKYIHLSHLDYIN